jgi:[acyl-carrier-protein] S-malonyltransferase
VAAVRTAGSSNEPDGRADAGLALVFPGQGSQTPDMRAVVQQERPDLLERACDLIGDDPFVRCAEGTRFAQPALYCAALAHWSRAGRPEGDVAAGHSLGEFAALAAAGCMADDDGLALVTLRGRLMQEAGDAAAPNGMAAVVGRDLSAVPAVAERHGLTLANDNGPRQIVLAGALADIERAAEELASMRIRCMPLPVSGAFHSPVMAPAVEPFRAALSAVELRRPRFTVMSGASAAPFERPGDELAESIARPVRWREVVLAMHARGSRRFLEPGPGRVLGGLLRRILPDASIESSAAEVPAGA